MNVSDTTSWVLAATAVVVGVGVVGAVWARERRAHRSARARHPVVQPPIAIGLDHEDGRPALRVALRRGADPVSIDIITYRVAGSTAEWASMPIVEPVRLEPGASTVLPTSLDRFPEAADVVVAWTAHHPTGDLHETRLLRVPAPAPLGGSGDRVAPDDRTTTFGSMVAVGLLAVLAVSAIVVARSAVNGGASDTAPPVPPTTPVTVETTAIAATTTAPTDTTATSALATATTAPATTVTTAATSSASTTAYGDGEATTRPRVDVDARLGPCRFSDDCLVVDFRIDGFTGRPQEYVCEFRDGSRFTFRFDSAGVDGACATANPADSVVVEVDGVRSNVVSRPDVTG